MEDTPSKKRRILAVLVTARTNKQWLSRKDLLRIASGGYVDKLLLEFRQDGLIERTGSRGRYRYRASKKTFQTFLEEGPLPRGPQEKGRLSKEERPRGHLVQLRPVTEFLDPDAMWVEHQRVSFQVDSWTAGVLREKCHPASRKDRAKQRSFSCSSFTVTITKRGVCQLIMKEPNWQRRLADWFLATGLSQASATSVLSMVKAQLPERFKRAEMPVLDRSLKARDVEFVVSTRVGDEKIVSNINYSTNIDWEIYGSAFLVDQFLSVLAGTQHNQVVALVALEQEIAQLSRKVNELEREREALEKKGRKKGDDYFV